jgi:hypothetical protein
MKTYEFPENLSYPFIDFTAAAAALWRWCGGKEKAVFKPRAHQEKYHLAESLRRI